MFYRWERIEILLNKVRYSHVASVLHWKSIANPKIFQSITASAVVETAHGSLCTSEYYLRLGTCRTWFGCKWNPRSGHSRKFLHLRGLKELLEWRSFRWPERDLSKCLWISSARPSTIVSLFHGQLAANCNLERRWNFGIMVNQIIWQVLLHIANTMKNKYH